MAQHKRSFFKNLPKKSTLTLDIIYIQNTFFRQLTIDNCFAKFVAEFNQKYGKVR